MDENPGDRDFTKPISLHEPPNQRGKNVTKSLIGRQMGQQKGYTAVEFRRLAEDKLVEKEVLEEMQCSLPESPRSTFLMVFSPDGKKIASTHGNHNVYVTDVASGKNIQTLSGHPRTPWCIAFHPSSNQILASGCLGGQVRVWDLSGGSEIWMASTQTVIASLAFHPIDRMLVVATCNKLYFWDWSQCEPFASCSTKTEREKVRYVTFDKLGNKLITGIANPVAVQSQWDRVGPHSHGPHPTTNATSVTTTSVGTTMSTSSTTATSHSTTPAEQSIAFCYRNLMNQYNALVRRYFDLSHRARATPTMDRGTDPMEIADESQPSTSGTQSTASRQPTVPPVDADAESTSSGSGSEVSLIVNPGGRRGRARSRVASRQSNQLGEASSTPQGSTNAELPAILLPTPPTLSSSSEQTTRPDSTSQASVRPRLPWDFPVEASSDSSNSSAIQNQGARSSSDYFITQVSELRNELRAEAAAAGNRSRTFLALHARLQESLETLLASRGRVLAREASNPQPAELSVLSEEYQRCVVYLLNLAIHERRLRRRRNRQVENGAATNSQVQEASQPPSTDEELRTLLDHMEEIRQVGDIEQTGSPVQEASISQPGEGLLRALQRVQRNRGGENREPGNGEPTDLASILQSIEPSDIRHGVESTRIHDMTELFIQQFLQRIRNRQNREAGNGEPTDSLMEEAVTSMSQPSGLRRAEESTRRRTITGQSHSSIRSIRQFLQRNRNSQNREAGNGEPTDSPVEGAVGSTSQPSEPTTVEDFHHDYLRRRRSIFILGNGETTDNSRQDSATSPRADANSPSGSRSSSRELSALVDGASSATVTPRAGSQSGEDSELLAADGEGVRRSDSPRAVVSRTENPAPHPRPVPTFMLGEGAFYRILANRETFGGPLGYTRPPARPHGQFVLSRHSNSPFQPRVPLRIEGPPITQPPATPPTIPSQVSSFWPAQKQRLLDALQRAGVRHWVHESALDESSMNMLLADRGNNQPGTSSEGTSNEASAVSDQPGPSFEGTSNEASAVSDQPEGAENEASAVIDQSEVAAPAVSTNELVAETNSGQPASPPSADASAGTASTAVTTDAPPLDSTHAPERPMHEQVRSYLDTMRSWTIEPSPADSTINFSRLTRESDADAGPDFSWDADTETLIIRPRENPSRVDTSDDDPPAVTTPTTVATAAAEPGSTSSSGSATLQPTRQRQPLSNHFEAVNRHIENLQRIVRARVDLLQMRAIRSTLRNLRNRLNEVPARGAASDTEPFDANLHGQVCRLRALVNELRSGIENVVRPRDVNAMLESASLNDTPGPSERQPAPLPPLVDSTKQLEELAAAMASDLMRCPENVQPRPGPSSAVDPLVENDPSMLTQLTSIVLGVALRRLEGDEASRPAPSRDSSHSPHHHHHHTHSRSSSANSALVRPISSQASSENQLRADGYHLERGSSNWRYHAYRMASSMERRIGRLKRTAEPNIPRPHRVRLKRSSGDQLELETTSTERYLHHRALNSSSAPSSAATTSTTEPPSTTSTSTTTPTCQSCGLRKKSSAAKRKASFPQRFRSVKRVRFSFPNPSQPQGRRESYHAQALENMIERMQNIVRMQRETQSGEGILTMTAEERALVTDIDNEVRRIGMPVRVRCTPQLLRTFRRSLAQLRAHQLLDSLVQSVSAFFEGNNGDVVDREIQRLYNLLQLALELTDLIVEQIRTSQKLDSTTTTAATDTSGEPPETGVPPVTTASASSSGHMLPRMTITRTHRFTNRSRTRHCSVTVTRVQVPPDSAAAGAARRPSYQIARGEDHLQILRECRNAIRSGSSTGDEPAGSRPVPVIRQGRTAAMERLHRRVRLIPVGVPPNRTVGNARRSVRQAPRITHYGHGGLPGRYVPRSGSEPSSEDNPPAENRPGPPIRLPPPPVDPLIPRLFSRSWHSRFATEDSNAEQMAVWHHRAPGEGRPSDPSFVLPVVPIVRVNDVPVSDTNVLSQSHYILSPPRVEEPSRWRYYRPRFLHPRYFGPNPFEDQDGDNNDLSQSNFPRSTGMYVDPIMVAETPVAPHHRIQAWDFSRHVIPDISDREINGVVPECKIHNDASVDVSSDGSLLVTLLPAGRLSVTTMLGVYSLEWHTLGNLLYKTGFEQSAVSVSLSPTARHLLVGLASRPLALRERDRTHMAQIFKLEVGVPADNCLRYTPRGVLKLTRGLEQSRENSAMSLNCIRWAPDPGCGLVYGTNTGQLVILR